METGHSDFDWDDAYANAAHIPDAASYPAAWASDAARFRDRWPSKELNVPYGSSERQAYDLFRPDGPEKGLAVFVHGGYWMKFDRSFWTHLAAGALDNGWAVCLPGYDLAPAVRISEITRQIGAAITAAASRIDGPIHLSGHSAGGHLVTRMVCGNGPLSDDVSGRIGKVLSISGLHDLDPLTRTAMNETLGLDGDEVGDESPALQEPLLSVPVTAWVGGGERPEFIRQSELLAKAWPTAQAYIDGSLHHFNVIDALKQKDSPITRSFLEL